VPLQGSDKTTCVNIRSPDTNAYSLSVVHVYGSVYDCCAALFVRGMFVIILSVISVVPNHK
jgi:hypothetical protein